MGKLQNEDFKTESELINLGATKASLLNDTKVYLSALGKTLDDAIADQDFAGSGGVGRNFIINGNFDVWQEATTDTNLPSGYYIADLFVYEKSGAMIHSMDRSSTVPNVNSRYSMLLSTTTIDASIGSTDYVLLTHRIEGYNYNQFANKTITLSFWVSAPITGTYCVSFRNSAKDRSYVAEYTVNVADTWEKKTVTLTMDSTGTWNKDVGIGVYVGFTQACGTAYQTTANAWQSGNYIATSNQVNGVSTTGSFRLSQIKLEIGASATDFTQDLASEVLAQVQRYFEKGFEAFYIQAVSGQNGSSTHTFCQTKRATPTMSYTIGTIIGFDTGSGATTLLSNQSFHRLYVGNATTSGLIYYLFTADARL